jgi:hypothetical protein
MLNDFIAQVKLGSIAKNNRYAVMFSPPFRVNPETLQKVLLFCDQVQLPGVNFSTVQNRTFGEFREVPYEKLYDNVSMSFYVDKDMKVKDMFDEWVNAIQDQSTKTFGYYNDYISDMTIEVQDTLDKTRYEMTLWECYPKTIGSIQLDYANKDIMKLTVNMQYKYWTSTIITPLDDGQQIPGEYVDRMTEDFTGFQRELNGVIGENVGEFVTASPTTSAITRLPALLRF